MRILFVMPEHNYIAKSFCNFIVHQIKKDIRKKTSIRALQIRVDKMLEDNFIQWIDEAPDQLSAKHVLNVIINNIDWGKVKRDYFIEINPLAIFPGSTTTVSSVARYLNYGTLTVRGCYFLSLIFEAYQKNIYKYLLFYRFKIGR